MNELRRFRNVWRMLESVGNCDTMDGMQYDRVYMAWVCYGCPRPIGLFIIVFANDRSTDTEHDLWDRMQGQASTWKVSTTGLN